MTAAVDPDLIAAINTLTIPCRCKGPHGDCRQPATTLITWTARLGPQVAHGPVPFCDTHRAELENHQAACAICDRAWGITAVRL